MRAYAMLANGMGGLDWSGLPIALAALGVPDEGIEPLVDALVTIKLHKPPTTER